MRRWSLVALLLCLPAGCGSAPGGARPDGRVAADLEAWLAERLGALPVAAIAVGVVGLDQRDGGRQEWSVALGRSPSGQPQSLAADAVWRVGSISKVVTARAALVLVERGLLELDAPVQHRLPWFRPQHPDAAAITLRHLLTHRSGLPPEPPVGHYWDADPPPLEVVVRSLADCELVSAPGSQFLYSNAGYAMVGALVATITGMSFRSAARTLVLAPLGLGDSDFALRPEWTERLVRGRIDTLDGRFVPMLPGPRGCIPALDLHCSIQDLATLAAGWLPGATVAAPASIGDAVDGCGFGCFVGRCGGEVAIGHRGIVHGTTSEIVALPEQGIAIAVACAADGANGLVAAVVDWTVRALLAERRGEHLPPPAPSAAVGVEASRALAGRYRRGDLWFDLRERDGELWFDPCEGVATRIRSVGGGLVSDDLRSMGDRTIRVVGPGIVNDGVDDYVRDERRPAPAPTGLLPLLGEYGFDHAAWTVYEDSGRLGLFSSGWVRDLPQSDGEDRFRCLVGCHTGQLLQFERDGDDKVIAMWIGGMRLPRRSALDDRSFRITPLQPVDRLRLAAKRARPPTPAPGQRAPELVDLRAIEPRLRFDVRYATADNFLGTPVYDVAGALLQRDAAAALQVAHLALRERGYGLCIFDGYRPWSVTKVFFDATPPELRHFVADPARGSRHNRGCAVDLTLWDLAADAAVPMPSGYDEFTVRAYPDWPGGTALQRWHRELLRAAMERVGFSVYEHEWWHFDFRDWDRFAVANEPLR